MTPQCDKNDLNVLWLLLHHCYEYYGYKYFSKCFKTPLSVFNSGALSQTPHSSLC